MDNKRYRDVDLDDDIDSYFHVYFLGTGGPSSLQRAGTSTLIKAGPHWLLFDTGRGMLQHMDQCALPVKNIRTVFYTHLHSDHVTGLGDFWMTGWFIHGRLESLSVFGPAGTARLIAGLREMHNFDLTVRLKYEGTHAPGLAIDVTEYDSGIVFDKDGVTVTAFLVDHGPAVKPAYGFRIDWQGRSIVISGDTTYCQNVVDHAKGCDLLIHELACGSPRVMSSSHLLAQVAKSHTLPEQLIDVCQQAKPRATLVNHVTTWRTTPYDMLAQVRAGYPGIVDLAEDRMEVLVGSDIKIFPPALPKVNRIHDATFGWRDDE